MDPDLTINMQTRFIASISRSAMMILSTNLNKRFNPYFSASELIIVFLAIHTLLKSVRNVPGFNASWRTLQDLMQYFMVHTLASYISSGNDGNDHTTILNLILVIITLEFIPAAKGWVGEDLESFTTSVSFIFSDKISDLLTNLHIPLFGATLSLCLEENGLLGRTLAFVGINTFSSLIFEAISGGELSLAWPLTLLYFIHEINSKYDMNTFFTFGLYRVSDAIYASLRSRKIQIETIFMSFLLIGSLCPKDPIWTGVCVLVFIQSGSDWFVGQLGIIYTTDPVLAGLCLITVMHFISIAIEKLNVNLKSAL